MCWEKTNKPVEGKGLCEECWKMRLESHVWIRLQRAWTSRLRILHIWATRSGCKFPNGGMIVNVLFLKRAGLSNGPLSLLCHEADNQGAKMAEKN